jgi:hypothetical protein
MWIGSSGLPRRIVLCVMTSVSGNISLLSAEYVMEALGSIEILARIYRFVFHNSVQYKQYITTKRLHSQFKILI